MKILLIEDDPMIGESLSQFLKNEGYAVNWCQNGASGSQAIEVEAYALVLLDLGLPDISGLDVLKKLRSMKVITPVLILTARDAIDDRVAGLNAGADDYLVKPFAIAELEARVRALLRRTTGHTGSELSNGEISLDVTKDCISGDGSIYLPAECTESHRQGLLHGFRKQRQFGDRPTSYD